MKIRIGIWLAGLMLLGLSLPREALARKNYTLGIGPAGNIWLFDTFPQLDPGVGGTVFFDYRYHPKFSTEVSVAVTSQDGAGISAADGSVEYFAIPTIDFKYYFLDEYGLWDPYAGIGFGFYLIGGGRSNDDSGGVGLGNQLILGTDYYLSDEFSIGFKGTYHSIGLIHSLDGGTNHDATAVIPYSLTGKIAFHW